MTSRGCSAMVDCEFCSIVNKELEGEELYRDDKVVGVLHLKPAAPGHILVFTAHHYPILEQVPDFEVGHVFSVANKLSTVVFETLGVDGTNIIIENGVAAGQSIPHVVAHIIPRHENDGLKLQWQPKKVGNDEMDIAQHQIKEQTENIHPSAFEKEKTQIVLEEESEGKKGEDKKSQKKKDDYRLSQLRRIP